jgi:protein-tyrosine phosphatase
VRSGVLWRADDLSLSPRDEVVDLHARGIRVVLDLRSMTESERSSGEHALAVGLECHQISLLETDADPVAMASALGDITTADDMGRWYATMAEQGAAAIVRGLELVAANPGATLFHCAAGKDRTGVFAAAVLSVLGADDDVIVEDYALTDDVIAAVLARLAPNAGTDHHLVLDVIDSGHPLLRAPAGAMRAMLAHLGQAHGGFTALLREVGLDTELADALRHRLVESEP